MLYLVRAVMETNTGEGRISLDKNSCSGAVDSITRDIKIITKESIMINASTRSCF